MNNKYKQIIKHDMVAIDLLKIKYLKGLALPLLFIFLFPHTTEAKHIVGGQASYRLIHSDRKLGGNATYEIKFNIYIDKFTGGADFDKSIFLGIFKKDISEWVFYERYDVKLKNKTFIKNSKNEKIYEKGEYIYNVTLPIINKSYRFTYQRCCRTNQIVNIENPEFTGATYSIDLTPEAQVLGNNSPFFKTFPSDILCINQYFNFDHSAIDYDQDSLVYEFFTPINGGGLLGSKPGTQDQINKCNGLIPLPDNCPPPYSNVIFKSPYTCDAAILGSQNLSINSKTGLLSGNPNGFGQYTIGVLVKEFRYGILIGSTKRDFLFKVTSCTSAVNEIKSQDINILPNPASDFIFISKSESIKRHTQIYIFNLLGNLVQTNKVNHNRKIDISGLIPGMYLLKIENSNKSYKIIVK